MAGIQNINNSVNSNSGKISSKLTFEVGEVFQARVDNIDNNSGEAALRTKDGWKFTAQLENNLGSSVQGLNTFVVAGYENGKLMLKLIPGAEDSEDNSSSNLDAILQKFSSSSGKEDLNLLKTLIEHNIPLTKENISAIKTIIDFKENAMSNDAKEEQFIKNYLDSKGIDLSSLKGREISETLKGFFEELKGLDLNELAAFKENGMELTGENIKSFNNVFKNEAVIYKELKNLADSLNIEKPNLSNGQGTALTEANKSTVNSDISYKDVLDNVQSGNIMENENFEENSNFVKNANTEQNKDTIEANPKETFNISNKIILDFKKSILMSDTRTEAYIDTYLHSKGISENSIQGKELKENFKNFFSELKDLDTSEIRNILENGAEAKGINLGNIKQLIKEDATAFNEYKSIMMKIGGEATAASNEEDNKLNLNKNTEKSSETTTSEDKTNITVGNSSKYISNSDINKLNSEKSIVDNFLKSTMDKLSNGKPNNLNKGKQVMQEIDSKISEMKDIIKNIISESGSDSNAFHKVMGSLNSNVNDFKVFNLMSNEYYYVDVPVNFAAKEYNCKLILKDDRKSGKKLDSKNIKIVASVNTINMGLIDTYIKVNDRNVSIKIDAIRKFTKLLDAAKTDLISKIAGKGYNVTVKVQDKPEEQQLNIVNCRSFFNDENIVNIDVRV